MGKPDHQTEPAQPARGDGRIVVPFVELDVTSAPAFGGWARERADAVDGDLRLDFRHVRFISAAAITTLLELHAQLVIEGRRLEITGADAFVAKVLGVCHLADLWSADRPLSAS
ncbi:MAG: STAS domain-containing protein [Actinomycetota bacterium]|nr:STAS domain-containing protein [Actinomycetota bacterium]